MTNIRKEIESFDWDHVEEVDDDKCYLINDTDEIAIIISKYDVLSLSETLTRITGMRRSGWDDYAEIHETQSPDQRWEGEKHQMIQDAWDKIKRVWVDASDEILKTVEPC